MGETTGLMTKRDKIKIVLFSILIGGLILVLMEMMFHSVLRSEYVSNLKFLTAKSNRYGQLIQRNQQTVLRYWAYRNHLKKRKFQP